MYCRVCGNKIEDFEELTNVLINANNLYDAYIDAEKTNVRIYCCPTCTHIQTENMLSDFHYKNYNLMILGKQSVKSGGNSLNRMDYYRKVISKLRDLGIDNNKILDIGCGHGTILKVASDYYESSEGIEPSEVECAFARENGCNVINTFFDMSFSGREYSAFIATQVFEHIPDPIESIKMCEIILKRGGVGYIEVPNGQGIWREKRYYDIYVEHINYFTIGSLVSLINTTNLEIISVGEVLAGYHLAAYVRKRKCNDSFSSKKEEDTVKLKHWLARYGSVAIWGSGNKGRTYIQLLKESDSDHVKYVFDSNETVAGYYMGNCNIPIEAPTEDKLSQCDLIIVTALEYYDEIKLFLQKKFHYQGQVVSIQEL